MAYQVRIKRSARKEIEALPMRNRRQVVAAIESLGEEPRPLGVRKLTGADNHYRIRVGDYRIVYEIADERLIVFVVRVGHRRGLSGDASILTTRNDPLH
jgi:mRNA interferase RelE/StbE